jgi:hypothetical protein
MWDGSTQKAKKEGRELSITDWRKVEKAERQEIRDKKLQLWSVEEF